MENLTRVRAGKKQSLSKKISVIKSATLSESLSVSDIKQSISELESRLSEAKNANEECKTQDPDNCPAHDEWMRELNESVNKLITDLQEELNNVEYHQDNKQINVQERGHDCIIQRAMVERETATSHFFSVIKKANGALSSYSEPQLRRLRKKIEDLTNEVKEKNTQYLSMVELNREPQREQWILAIMENSDDTLDKIDTALDKFALIAPISSPVESEHNDLGRLKRISLPTFAGNKKEYASWRAAFDEFVDKSATSNEYKLLQLKGALKGALKGEALNVTVGLGHSGSAYACALDRLERKFGGDRRVNSMILEEIALFKPIRKDYPADLEKFSDLLEALILRFTDAKKSEELGKGIIYITLQKKLPTQILTNYQRWIYEANKEESVLALKEYVMKKSTIPYGCS